MRVAIAGAHGKIALRLIPRLAGRGDTVTGLIRNPDHADEVRQAGAEPVVCDLEHASPAELEALLHDVPVSRQIFYLNAGEAPIREALERLADTRG